METMEISKTTITDSGALVKVKQSLPNNFEKLSGRKKKELILSALQDNLINFSKTASIKNEIEEEAKLLAQKINLSKEAKELAKLRRQIKELKELYHIQISEHNGMLKLTKKLGFDAEAEVKKMRLIE